MVIFDRKTVSNRNENGKFVISSPDLPKTDINKIMRMFYGKLHSNLKKIKNIGSCRCFSKKIIRKLKNRPTYR